MNPVFEKAQALLDHRYPEGLLISNTPTDFFDRGLPLVNFVHAVMHHRDGGYHNYTYRPKGSLEYEKESSVKRSPTDWYRLLKNYRPGTSFEEMILMFAANSSRGPHYDKQNYNEKPFCTWYCGTANVRCFSLPMYAVYNDYPGYIKDKSEHDLDELFQRAYTGLWTYAKHLLDAQTTRAYYAAKP